jgi:hypothetical protein
MIMKADFLVSNINPLPDITYAIAGVPKKFFLYRATHRRCWVLCGWFRS